MLHECILFLPFFLIGLMSSRSVSGSLTQRRLAIGEPLIHSSLRPSVDFFSDSSPGR